VPVDWLVPDIVPPLIIFIEFSETVTAHPRSADAYTASLTFALSGLLHATVPTVASETTVPGDKALAASPKEISDCGELEKYPTTPIKRATKTREPIRYFLFNI
jgi:hypothetical protein